MRKILLLLFPLMCSCVTKHEPAAIINGKEVSLEQVDSRINEKLQKILNTVYKYRMQALDSIIEENLFTLEAESRKMSKKELFNSEVVKGISDSIIESKAKELNGVITDRRNPMQVYDLNSQQGRELLIEGLIAERRNAYMNELRLKYKDLIKINLKNPNKKVLLVDISKIDVKFKDQPKTENSFIIVGNYDCSNCKKAEPIFDELYREFKNCYSYGFAFYDDTLTLASRAAQAAARQNKFWEFHDKMMATNRSIDSAMIFALAKEFNLNMSQFNSDFRSREIDRKTINNIITLQKSGIAQTPTLLINGKIYNGPFTKSALTDYLKHELK